MGLIPEWTAEVEGAIERVRHHEQPNVLSVQVDGDDGSGLRVVDAADGTVRGTCSLSDGMTGAVRFGGAERLFVTTRDGHAHAVDPETGTKDWHVTLSETSADLAFDDGTLFVMTTDDRVYAIDAGTGARRWDATLPESGRDLAIDGESLLVTVGGSDERGVVGFDPTTGDRRWFRRPDPDLRTEAAVVEDGIYVVERNGDEGETTIASLDGRTGSAAWTYRVDDGTPEIEPTGDAVYVGWSDGVAALDPSTGDVAWESNECDSINRIWPGRERVYVRFGGAVRGNDLAALAPETGRVEWTIGFDSTVRTLHGADADGDNGIYVRTAGDELHRVYESTGRIDWSHEASDPVRDVSVTDAVVVVRESADTVRAIERANGRSRWSFESDEAVSVRRVTDAYVVVSGSTDVSVIRQSDGTVEAELPGSDEGSLLSSVLSGRGESADRPHPEEASAYSDEGLFYGDGSTITAYPLTSSPSAFEEATRREGTDTVVFDGPSSDEERTQVYDGSGDRSETDPSTGGESESESDPSTGGDPPTDFCPHCGTDLGGFGAIAFCPDCGGELPT